MLVVLLLTICAIPLVGGALSGAGYSVVDFVANHPSNGQYGPIGVIFQRDETFWLSNVHEGKMYHLSSTGVVLSVRDESANGGTYMRGQAFSKTERLYVCYYNGTLVEWSTTNNAPLRQVAPVPGCLGLACDPISGDLFATDLGTPRVWRISNFESGTVSVTSYFTASPPTAIFDGIAISPGGMIYVAEVAATGGPWQITGVNKPQPATGYRLAVLGTIDGISVGVNIFDVEAPPFVVGSTNTGILGLVDLTVNPPQVQHILTGGTRGDFSVVGYDGCIYATQTNTVVKIGKDTGGCLDLYPTCPNLVPNISFVNPNQEDATINTQWCTQIRMEDNPESLRWTCEIVWGDSLVPQPCTFTTNPETITVCHTYTTIVAGVLPIVVTVTDDQKFPSAARKFVRTVAPATTTTTTTSNPASTTINPASTTNNPASTTINPASTTTATVSVTGGSTATISVTGGGTDTGGNTQTGAVSAGTVLSYGMSFVIAIFIARGIFVAFRE